MQRLSFGIWSRRQIRLMFVLPAITLGLLLIGTFAYSAADYYRRSADLAHAAQLRDQIMTPYIFGINPPSTDYLTGNLHFPEVRLMLPRPAVTAEPLKLSYATSENDGKIALHVTHLLVMDRVTRPVRNAQHVDQIYDAMPHIGACGRGVTVTSERSSEDAHIALRHVVETADGRTIYIYLENGCPEMAMTADFLAGLRSY